MILIMSILNVVRHLFFVIQIWFKPDGERERYTLDDKSLLMLGLSITFIISSLFTGVYV